ncbi:unnamed protein product [Cochlearia groenlandica]
MGRIVECKHTDGYKVIEENISKQYDLARDVLVELTYFNRNDVDVKPVTISSDVDLNVFRHLVVNDSSTNLFASFRIMVAGEMQFVEKVVTCNVKAANVTNFAQIGEGLCDVLIDKEYNIDDLMIAAAVAVEKQNNLSKRMTGQSSYNDHMVMETNPRGGINASVDNHTSGAEDVEIAPDSEDEDTEYESEDYDFDHWSEIVNQVNEEAAVYDGVDDDDFVETPIVRKSGESKSLRVCSTDVSVDDVYGFEDVEPMFNCLESYSL